MNMHARYALLCLTILFSLAGCGSSPPAPVSDSRAPTLVIEKPAAATQPTAAALPAAAEARPGMHTVKRGDTLYSIALDHGQSYRDVAAWNGLEDPNKILVGQQLRVLPPEAPPPVAVAKPISVPTPVEVRPMGQGAAAVVSANTDNLKREPRAGKRPYSEETLAAMRRADALAPVLPPPPALPEPEPRVEPKAPSEEEVDWGWPMSGKMLNAFVEGGNKGIDIAAKSGDAVLAAAAGKVVYAGSSLRGYGKLVIVKHNAAFLSAYAHNSQILVKEGASVQKGQKIAEAGATDAEQPMLHFEIRRQGKPVDPQKHLPSR